MRIVNSLSANALNAIITSVVKLDPNAREKAMALGGKTVALKINDFDLTYIIAFSQFDSSSAFDSEQPLVQVFDQYGDNPSVLLAGDSFAFFNMATATNGGDALFKGDVIFTGEISTAQLFEKFWQQLDLDWQEALSKYTGDVIAHQISELVSRATSRFKKQTQQLANNTHDRLTEELHLTPHKLELERFFDHVDELSSRVQRLHAKVARLASNVNATQDEK